MKVADEQMLDNQSQVTHSPNTAEGFKFYRKSNQNERENPIKKN